MIARTCYTCTSYNGVPAIAEGTEQWIEFTNGAGEKLVQYGHRDWRGSLFFCIAPTVDEARAFRLSFVGSYYHSGPGNRPTAQGDARHDNRNIQNPQRCNQIRVHAA
jgi:hypothetical protein